MPTDYKISVKEYYRISKKNDLEIETDKMWHLKTTTVPVIVGALGKVKKDTDKHIDKITVCPSLYEIQKHYFAKLRGLSKYIGPSDN